MPAGLAALFPSGPPAGLPGDPGLFGPGSEVWRIGRERVLLAAGPAALLLQLAHPLVAAGVADHSRFSADPLGRLRATLDATLTVTFGDSRQAAAAAARVRSRHRYVTGRTRSTIGRFPAGTPYRAEDPQLALWVHATLVWTALELYDGFIAPLTDGRRARYLDEMSRSGRLFGVPQELLPRSYADFENYLRAMDEEAVLEVGPQARAIAEEIRSTGVFAVGGPVGVGIGALADVLTAGLLPPRLRAGYGLRWGWRERQAFLAARLLTRVAVPAQPPRVRYWPHYLAALRRTAAPRGSRVLVPTG
ncbi:MAG TPA: oxygenase MpaB family protein [Geodermatophilus sp.]|nr:oxygenase MpaB family protein [Geodermatophilus sp.]